MTLFIKLNSSDVTLGEKIIQCLFVIFCTSWRCFLVLFKKKYAVRERERERERESERERER